MLTWHAPVTQASWYLSWISYSQTSLTPNDPLQFDGEERLGLCRDVSCDDEKSVEKLKIITVYIIIGLAPEKEKKKNKEKT